MTTGHGSEEALIENATDGDGKVGGSPKKRKEIVWQSYSLDEYRDVARNLVHFSFKTVNSNAESGGIRLSQLDALDLPYVCARSLLQTEAIELDYAKASGNVAGVVRQIRTSLIDPACTEQEALDIHMAVAAVSAKHFEIGTSFVDARLRQVLLPVDPDADLYLAVTPLTAAGVGASLAKAVFKHNEQCTNTEPTKRRIKLGFVGVGGSNTQNVGSLTRHMQSPLYVVAPTEDPETRQALAVHYKGVPLRLSSALMRNYRKFLNSKLRSSAKSRTAEADLVCGIARDLLTRGRSAAELLKRQANLFGDSDQVAAHVAPVVRGLIIPGLREKGWLPTFAAKVAELITMHSFDKEGTRLAIGDKERHQIERWIASGIRKEVA